MPHQPTPIASLLTGDPSWIARYATVLEKYEAARVKASAMPKDAAVEMARREALGEVHGIEKDAASDFIFGLRMADRHNADALRTLIGESVRDAVDVAVHELRQDVQDLAEAVAALEGKAVAA